MKKKNRRRIERLLPFFFLVIGAMIIWVDIKHKEPTGEHSSMAKQVGKGAR